MGWAQTGTELVPSKLFADTRVRMCELDEALAYYGFVYLKAMQFPGAGEQCVQWLLQCDHATRTKAQAYFLAGWPWGEALRHSIGIFEPAAFDGDGELRPKMDKQWRRSNTFRLTQNG